MDGIQNIVCRIQKMGIHRRERGEIQNTGIFLQGLGRDIYETSK